MNESQQPRRHMSNAELLSFEACGVNPYDAERIDPHEHFQRDTAAHWCLGRLLIGGCACARLCDGCKINANNTKRQTWAKAHPFDTQREPGRPYHWGMADWVIVERGSPEAAAELARRQAHLDLLRAQNDGRDVDAGLVAALVTA